MFSHEELLKAYEYGVDYGLLIAEQERDSEELYDILSCRLVSTKYCLPSAPAPRRQPHSAAWRQAKVNSMKNFIELFGKEDDRV